MKKNVLKRIVVGVLLGTLVFFTGPLILIVLLLKFIFTPFGMGRALMHRGSAGPMGFSPQMRFAMAEQIRSMSDEEFASFKEKSSNQSNCTKSK